MLVGCVVGLVAGWWCGFAAPPRGTQKKGSREGGYLGVRDSDK